EEVESIESADVQVADEGGGGDDLYGDAWPVFDRIIDGYTAKTVRKGTLNTLIAHRNSAAWSNDPTHRFFGFDGGSLKVALGLRLGLTDHLDFGALRMNGTAEAYDTYEFDVRYHFLRQEKSGLDMAVRAGITWFFHNEGVKDAAGALLQVLMSRIIKHRLILGGGLLYHTSSSGPAKSPLDSKSSTAVMVFADIRFFEWMSLSAEYTQALAGYHVENACIAMATRFITNRHTFSIVLSNTQWMTADGIITNSARSGLSNYILGFNITREI
ncbi:MAG TPA: DUF5777 family beta-barrel protein, partial [Myxococcota bacterium]|nr:DUF5777 family beta-barrel protein [Myxococcota bacterium]